MKILNELILKNNLHLINMKNRLFIVFDQQLYFYITSHKLLSIKNWRDRLGIEPSKPGTQVSDGFEDRGGHQNPIQPRNDIIII